MPNEVKLLPCDRAIADALSDLKFGMDFAYEQGLHEFGYDPVETVRAALTRPTTLVTDEVVEAASHFADEMDGLLPYLASHNWRIDRLADAVTRVRAAIEAMPTVVTGEQPLQSVGAITYIERFVRESNYIEGIEETTDAHIEAHCTFLDGAVTIPALVALVKVLQPNARFRNAVNIPGVRVGNHIAPPSGPDIEGNLRSILAMRDPWEQHIAYETLHPFTDGNGRSGRAVWLHRHFHEDDLDQWAIRRGFLHSFYYHTLSGVRLASAGRSGNRQDRETGLGPKDDSAGRRHRPERFA